MRGVSGYQVLSRRRGRGELRKFVLDVVDFTPPIPPAPYWEIGGRISNASFSTGAGQYAQLHRTGDSQLILGAYYPTIIATSGDGGKAFTERTAPLVYEGRFGEFVNFNNGKVLMRVASRRYTYISDDKGATWIRYHDISDYGSVSCLISLDDGRLLRGAGQKRVLWSDDYGASWAVGGDIDPEHSNPIMYQMLQLGDGTILARPTENYAYSPARQYIYKSYDRGVTWHKTGYPHYIQNALEMYYLGNGAVIIPTYNPSAGISPIMRSTDYGETFASLAPLKKTLINGQSVEANPDWGCCIRPGVGLFCSRYYDGDVGEWGATCLAFYRTEDYGATWHELTTLALDPYQTGLWYILGNPLVAINHNTAAICMVYENHLHTVLLKNI